MRFFPSIESLTTVLLVGVIVTSCPADPPPGDRWLRRTPSGTPMWIGGEILSYDRHNIRYQPSPDLEPVYRDAEEVLAVRPALTRPHAKGLQLLEAKEFPAAAEQFRLALSFETRDWVKGEILVGLIQTAAHRGDTIEEVRRFLELIELDSETRHFDQIPVAWTTPALTGDRRTFLRSLLNSGGDNAAAAQLIAASHLLFDPKAGEAAEVTMKRLARTAIGEVRALAEFQVDRLDPKPWSEFAYDLRAGRLPNLPEALRTGPRMVLARKRMASRDFEGAAALLMKNAISHGDQVRIARRSLFEAAEALDRRGDRNAALTLHREVLVRFPGSEESDLSRAKLTESVPD